MTADSSATLVLRSDKLAGVTHGFSTRRGGVSSGRYESLNLGGKWGDDPSHVAENRRRFAAAVPFAIERLHVARQVHGARVLVVGPESRPEETAQEEADAIVTRTRGVALGVMTADCVPVLLSAPGGIVAAAHAGWRGAVAGVIEAAVEQMVALGARRGELRAALGPSICVRCFEVGEEVAARFEGVEGAVERSGGAQRPHVDLHRFCASRLISVGVAAERIDAEPACTMCEAERFFSFRRDGGQIGQQLSVIVP